MKDLEKRVALTEQQQELVEKFRAVVEEMRDNRMFLAYDAECDSLCAINTSELDGLSTTPTEGHCVDIVNMMEPISWFYFVGSETEIFAKLKD